MVNKGEILIMDIDQMLPIVSEGIQWVKDQMKPSKKELGLRISELEEQVKDLSYGNQIFQENFNQIISTILMQLKSEGNYFINADTIIQIRNNSGEINILQDREEKFAQVDNLKSKKNCAIFDNMDEEILRCKLDRPSEREEN